MKKRAIEIQLVRAVLSGVPEKKLPISRNLGCVDLIWPRSGIARKSAAREMVFRRGLADFEDEPWAKRVLFREDVEDRCGLAVTVTEPVSIQVARRYFRLIAKYALKMGADFMEKAMVGYNDIASAPLDALAQMLGEKDAPKAIAQGVVDVVSLPDEGSEIGLDIPLRRPLTGKVIGTLSVLIRG